MATRSPEAPVPGSPDARDTARGVSRAPRIGSAGVVTRLAIAGGLIGAYALSIALEPAELPGVTVCLVKNLTGLDCPSCGLTRGFLLISHGELRDASALNALALPVYALGLVLAPLLAWEAATRRDVVDRLLRSRPATVACVAVAAVALRYVALLV